MLIKPQQCSAARDLLGITPEILAGYAGVSVESVIGFEARKPDIPNSIAETIQVALEYAGVVFLKTDETDQQMVRLRSYYTPITSSPSPRASDIKVEQK
jgi:hypothetical protein